MPPCSSRRFLLLTCLTLFGKVASAQNVTDVIDRVEFVQTIQQLQTLDALQKSLTANGQPPVPMFAEKATALRVYGNPATVKGAYTIVATLPGEAKDATASVIFSKDTPSVNSQRLLSVNRFGVTFYFKPPEGNWSVILNVIDKDKKALAGPLTFAFQKSAKQQTLAVSTVFVCDAMNAKKEWLCPQKNTVGAAVLKSRFRFLTAILPTLSTSISPSETRIELDKSTFVKEAGWYVQVLKEIGLDAKKREKKDAPPDGQLQFYLGLARPDVAASITGMAGGIPARTALALSQSDSPYQHKGGGGPYDDTEETWAHEIGHGLGLRHTNLVNPKSKDFPGCYLTAADPGTDWPFSDNRIRSLNADKTTPLEVGFRVDTKAPVRFDASADNEFELMAYCLPQWIAPTNYNKASILLAPGAKLTPLAVRSNLPSAASSNTLYWELTGNIENGVATIDPIFQSSLPGPPDAGSGAYHIAVSDAGRNVLWQQHFDPNTPWVENNLGTVVDAGMYFTALVPFQPTAQRISILDPSNAEIAYVLLHSVGPLVRIATQLGGKTVTGEQQLDWIALGATPAPLTSRVEYSPDLGANWFQIAQNLDSSLLFDFANVPGSNPNSALIRISASDGIAMGQAVSAPFTVSKKTPFDPTISNPKDGEAYGPEDTIVLQGGALQTDTILHGSQVKWSSSIDGALGTGETLTVPNLSPGNHTIQMTATNADNNSVSATIQVSVASGLPAVSVTSPSNCVVTVGATADPFVALSKFAYSLDGGSTFKAAKLSDLPLSISLTNGSAVSVVAYATDAARQSGFASNDFNFAPSCQ